MNLKTKDEIIKINMTTSELSLIVEHMYFNLANVTENFTENMKIYDKDVKFYKYLKNLLRQ
jgi:hypothetical protein